MWFQTCLTRNSVSVTASASSMLQHRKARRYRAHQALWATSQALGGDQPGAGGTALWSQQCTEGWPSDWAQSHLGRQMGSNSLRLT